MGNMIEKLNYLKDTKDIFNKKLLSIGQEIESGTTFRRYLDWTDKFFKKAMKDNYLYTYGIDAGWDDRQPTQNNPIKYQTITGETKISTNPYKEGDLFNYSKTISEIQKVTDVSPNSSKGRFSFKIPSSSQSEIKLCFDYQEELDYMVQFYPECRLDFNQPLSPVSYSIEINGQTIIAEAGEEREVSFNIPKELASTGEITIKNLTSTEPNALFIISNLFIGKGSVYEVDFGDLELCPGHFEVSDVCKKGYLNLFNKKAEYDNSITSTEWIVSELETGIRVSNNATETGTTQKIRYWLNKLSDFSSDSISVHLRADSNVSGERIAGYSIGCGSTVDTVNITGEWAYIFLENADPEERLFVEFECTPEQGATINDYIDYTNIEVWVSDPLDLIWGPKGKSNIKFYSPYTDTPVWFIMKNYNKIILNGTEEEWTCEDFDVYHVMTFPVEDDYADGNEECITDYFKTIEGKSYYEKAPSTCFCKDGILYFFTDQQSTLEEWKEWLSTHNMAVYYSIDPWKNINAIEDKNLVNQLDNILFSESGKIVGRYFDGFFDDKSSEPSGDNEDDEAPES